MNTTPYDRPLESLLQASVEIFLAGINSTDYQFIAIDYSHAISTDFLAIISHNSQLMRGTLAVQANKDFFVKTYPAAGILVTDDDAGQWACEMTNRIMGIVKSKIVAYGVALEIGIPTIAKGNPIELLRSPLAATMAMSFRKNADQWFSVVFSSIIDPSVSFEGEPKENLVIGEAGDGIIF